MAVETTITAPQKPSRKGKHAASRRARKPKPDRGKRGFFRRFWWLFVAVPVGLVVTAFAVLFVMYQRLELPEPAVPAQTTYIYDANGDLITTLHAAVDRTIIPLDQMPEALRNAVIAVEDQDFYRHPGFDPIGITRAAWNDLRGNPIQGGSTITQQLVKKAYAGSFRTNRRGEEVYVEPDRTVPQKVREVMLAIKLEQELTKDEILANYLNTIYFGRGAYGVQAAARTYWSKPAKMLTVAESAMLAGLIASPETFDPVDAPDEARARRDHVIDRMVTEGYLEPERAAAVRAKELTVNPPEAGPVDYEAPYFVQYVKKELQDKYGSAAVFSGGLRVRTSLDPEIQHLAQRAVRDNLSDRDGPEAAVVAIEPSTGAVVAMVGGRNFDRSQVNLALGQGAGGSGRSAGSAFKPFVLAEAMHQGLSLTSGSWYGPSTITIPDEECYTYGRPWAPSNASDSQSGSFTLESATAYSVNTVFAQLIVKLGPENVVAMARDLGIESPLQPNCAVALGSVEVNPLEMTNAYATFAARGVRHRATPLRMVRDASGEPIGGLYRHGPQNPPQGTRVLGPNEANLVTYALEGVIAEGTGTAADIGRDAAGKTGTAQDYSDAWFCGYTPQLATCVWMGYTKDRRPLVNVEGYPYVYGGTIPANIWRDFMAAAMKLYPDRKQFAEPDFGQNTLVPTPTVAPTTAEPTQEPTETPSEKPTEENPTENPPGGAPTPPTGGPPGNG